jgi:hypothetical protein
VVTKARKSAMMFIPLENGMLIWQLVSMKENESLGRMFEPT